MKKLYVLIAIICISYHLSSQISCSSSIAGSCSISSQASIGTGTTVNAYPNFPSVYGHWYKNTRHQLLFTASELTNAGVLPGNISSVSFIVNSFHTGYIGALPGLTINLKCVTQNSVTNVFDNIGLTQVYSTTSYTPVIGINTHNFSNPYIWDGVSDLLIDICYTFNINVLYTNNPIMPFTSTSVPRCLYSASDISNLCGIDTIPPTLTYQRPNIIFENCINSTSLNSNNNISNILSIFPNPNNGVFTISAATSIESLNITIVNTLGQTVKT